MCSFDIHALILAIFEGKVVTLKWAQQKKFSKFRVHFLNNDLTEKPHKQNLIKCLIRFYSCYCFKIEPTIEKSWMPQFLPSLWFFLKITADTENVQIEFCGLESIQNPSTFTIFLEKEVL